MKASELLNVLKTVDPDDEIWVDFGDDDYRQAMGVDPSALSELVGIEGANIVVIW